jgi:hypothetical protein
MRVARMDSAPDRAQLNGMHLALREAWAASRLIALAFGPAGGGGAQGASACVLRSIVLHRRHECVAPARSRGRYDGAGQQHGVGHGRWTRNPGVAVPASASRCSELVRKSSTRGGWLRVPESPAVRNGHVRRRWGIRQGRQQPLVEKEPSPKAGGSRWPATAVTVPWTSLRAGS